MIVLLLPSMISLSSAASVITQSAVNNIEMLSSIPQLNQSLTTTINTTNTVLNETIIIDRIVADEVPDDDIGTEQPKLFAETTTTEKPYLPTVAMFGKLYKKADSRKRKIERKSIVISQSDLTEWKCPNISSDRNLECGCDMPHTLRCNGDIHSLGVS